MERGTETTTLNAIRNLMESLVKDIYELSVMSSLKKYDETVLEVLLE